MESVITVWEKFYDNTWNFNHIEYGYDPVATAPVPKFDNQKGWKGSKWRSKEARLVDGVVIELQVG